MGEKKYETKEEALIKKHSETLWVHFANLFLGFWLLVSHIAFGYVSLFYVWNAIICGIIVIVFSVLSLSRRMILAPWIVGFTGMWLMFAPLVFSTPEVQIYVNDTIVGVLLIAFALLVPGIPGVIEEKGHDIPPGWSYNPSAWIQRIPVIALGCVGWMISRYLAAFQLGYIDSVWDPAFGDGTYYVITSNVAKFFPVPDAGLGAFAYTLEALMGCKGGANRWRTMPWMVVAFAFLVVPLGIVSILLVISQPILVHHWCFLCLVAAGSMLIMVTLTMDEMFAVLYFLYCSKKEGKGFWKTFFKGGDCLGTQDDTRTPPFDSNPIGLIATWRYGISFQWNLLLTAALGVWLMFTPHVFGLPVELGISDNDHLIGALVVVISIISLAEVARSLRWLLPIAGLWIAIASWFFPSATLGLSFNHLGIGILLFFLALPRGKINESYGLWTRCIR